MSGKTRKTIIYLALPLAIIWGVFNFSGKRSKKVDPEAPTTLQPLSQISAVQSSGDMIHIKEKARASWGADPFRARKPVKASSPSEPTWNLSGIVYNSQTPLAIINNRPVRAGDVVNNATVVSIKAKTVTLERDGTRWTLTVTKG